ncbi:MAG TPA: four helix bundle protein [Terriglobia bacterium]|nr:four helix bundle protein [Terriglobia bacterium]
MATIRRFEDIQAWEKARQLVREVYRVSAVGKFQRDYGLRDQICRAAVSSMSNIAEGFARKTGREFARFLDVARGSAIEVQSLLYVSLDVGYISADEFKILHELADEVISLVSGFTTYLRRLRAERQ